MASLTPEFNGSYDGHLIYNMTEFAISNFEQYIESLDLEYRSIFDRHMTGFEDTIYLTNANDATKMLADISITLVGDLPFAMVQHFTQLAKGVLGGGMTLIFQDDEITGKKYYGKWIDAVDFVENNEVFGGGLLTLAVYKITDI